MKIKMNSLLVNRKFFVRNKSDKGAFYSYSEASLYKIGKYIQRDKKDIGFWVNQLKPGITDTHTKESFDIPCVSWLDIDFHNQENIDDFKKDIKSMKKFMDDLKKDPMVFLCGRTLSGGIRIMGLVDSYYLDYAKDLYENNLEDDEQWLDKQNDIYKVNNYLFTKYIVDKHHLSFSGSYLDACASKISQPTFPLKKGTVHINYDCDNIYNTTDISVLKNSNELKRITTNKSDTLEMNVKNDVNMFNLLYEEKNMTDLELHQICVENNNLIKDIYNRDINIIKPFLTTYTPILGSIMRFADQESMNIWYELCCKYYKGKSFLPYLENFEIFTNFLYHSKNLKFAPSLYNQLIKV